jgi:microcystin-dependent protein
VSTGYIGEIRLFAGNFAPAGWAFCEGQVMPIASNDTLFNLIGTTYGGDGVSTFGLPDLRGRVPIHQGTNRQGTFYVQGQRAGVESVTLTTAQIPGHTHPVSASTANGTQAGPGNKVLASGIPMYVTDTPDQTLNAASVRPSGGNQPHENRQPFLCVSFIISLFGVFPSQN